MWPKQSHRRGDKWCRQKRALSNTSGANGGCRDAARIVVDRKNHGIVAQKRPSESVWSATLSFLSDSRRRTAAIPKSDNVAMKPELMIYDLQECEREGF